MPVISLCVFYYSSGSSNFRFEKMFIWKEKLLKKCKYVKPNEISHRLISRTAEKEEDSEKKAEQNVETKLDSGKQEKKENAVERSVENIRIDSAEGALPYELVIVEAEKK